MAAEAFSRRRKISLQTLVYSILNYRGKTQKMELRNFLKVSRANIAISTWGYTKARLKINPEAFICLRDHYLEGYYCKENKDLLNYKGYIPVAIDGSDLHIPYTEENRLIYGDANSRSEYPVVMASCSCAYDVCNDMILDCALERYKRTERESARDHIKKIEERYSQEFVAASNIGYTFVPRELSGEGWRFYGYTDAGKYYPTLTAAYRRYNGVSALRHRCRKAFITKTVFHITAK